MILLGYPCLIIANFRALDESLHIRSEQKNFLNMMRYCAKAVFLDRISREGGWGRLGAWIGFIGVVIKVRIYEYWVDFKSRFRSEYEYS